MFATVGFKNQRLLLSVNLNCNLFFRWIYNYGFCGVTFLILPLDFNQAIQNLLNKVPPDKIISKLAVIVQLY